MFDLDYINELLYFKIPSKSYQGKSANISEARFSARINKEIKLLEGNED